MASKTIQTDIAIVGAGLVGLTSAIALSRLGYQVTLVNKYPLMKRVQKDWDARVYALTQANQQWLAEIGVWKHVNVKRVNPIDAMHLWHKSEENTPDLVLEADTANLFDMGCILENQNLMVAAWKVLKTSGVTIITDVSCETVDNSREDVSMLTLSNGQIVQTKLLIGADGMNSWVRQQFNIGVQAKAFNQTAIVANFKTNKAHHNVAKQWFSPHETLALLPLTEGHVSLVWSMGTDALNKQLNSIETTLAEAVMKRTNLMHDGLLLSEDLKTFPLQQQVANQLISQRCVLLGDAAHQVHPMAGQGVNLGFKGVMVLSQVLKVLSPLHDIGDKHVLRGYEREIKQNILELTGLTSGLDTLFAIDNQFVKQLVSRGMYWVNQSSVLKKQMVKLATL